MRQDRLRGSEPPAAASSHDPGRPTTRPVEMAPRHGGRAGLSIPRQVYRQSHAHIQIGENRSQPAASYSFNLPKGIQPDGNKQGIQRHERSKGAIAVHLIYDPHSHFPRSRCFRSEIQPANNRLGVRRGNCRCGDRRGYSPPPSATALPEAPTRMITATATLTRCDLSLVTSSVARESCIDVSPAETSIPSGPYPNSPVSGPQENAQNY